MIDAESVIAAARECLGTPFQHQGRRAGVGLDCAGLICHVAGKMGLPHDTPADYPRDPYDGLLERVLDAQACLLRVDPSELAPGDVLLFRRGRSRRPRHLGIWSGASLIHAAYPPGRVIEHRLDEGWRDSIARVYRFREPTA